VRCWCSGTLGTAAAAWLRAHEGRHADVEALAARLTCELLQARGGPSGAERRGAGHHGDLMTAVRVHA
jgi:hypothetical protein